VTIRASVTTVEKTLIGSVCLVILVVFIFLRSLRATLIPFVAVPISLIGTFAIMYLLDYTLDNLSLMAIVVQRDLWSTTRSWSWKTSRGISKRYGAGCGRAPGREGDRVYSLLKSACR